MSFKLLEIGRGALRRGRVGRARVLTRRIGRCAEETQSVSKGRFGSAEPEWCASIRACAWRGRDAGDGEPFDFRGKALALSGDVGKESLKVSARLDASTLKRIAFADGRPGATVQTAEGYIRKSKGFILVVR